MTPIVFAPEVGKAGNLDKFQKTKNQVDENDRNRKICCTKYPSILRIQNAI